MDEQLVLEACGVTAGYGGPPAIRDCNLQVARGATVALLGRNGAGKTTLVSTMSGRIRLDAGHVYIEGKDVSSLSAHRRNRAGLAHVPQGREIFGSLTVTENLLLGSRHSDSPSIQLCYELFPWLSKRGKQRAGTLSGGEQQMLAIARGLVTEPAILILDEPSLGLAPAIVAMLFEKIGELRTKTNMAVLLVEQQLRWVFEAGQVSKIYVMDNGSILRSGTPEEISEDSLKEDYFGAG